MNNKIVFLKIDDATGETVTYGSLVERVDKLSAALHDRGLRKGDAVCLYADKSITGVITVYAVVSLGAVLTPCRPSHTSGKYRNIMQINIEQLYEPEDCSISNTTPPQVQ